MQLPPYLYKYYKLKYMDNLLFKGKNALTEFQGLSNV